MKTVDLVFAGEYFEVANEVFVFARVGKVEWNFISIGSGQPYSEVAFSSPDHNWWKAFDARELEFFFGFLFTSDKKNNKIGYMRKLEKHEDFIIRVKDYSGKDFQFGQ